MTKLQQGAFRLCQMAGIDLYLHWTWFLVAAWEISDRAGRYSSVSWNVLEYLGLFLIVTLHEYGHALACRQVGGKADRIVLWPLGGVAYVQPPPRPGATLWSIAAGPLVNAVLVPVLGMLAWLSRGPSWADTLSNLHALLHTLWYVNLVLLIFNLFPVYPLDGGQILRALLWFKVGPVRSLEWSAVFGLLGATAMIFFAVQMHSAWIAVICAFILINCWQGLKHAQALARRPKLPRRQGFACPSCKKAPPVGLFWVCSQCRKKFDTFLAHAACPNCGTQFSTTKCIDCGSVHPMSEWSAPAPAPVPNLAG